MNPYSVHARAEGEAQTLPAYAYNYETVKTPLGAADQYLCDCLPDFATPQPESQS